MTRTLKLIAVLMAFIGAGFVLRFILWIAHKTPSNERNWQADVANMPTATFSGDTLTLDNVRNTRYGAPGKPYEVVWDERRYDLRTLKRLWFVLEPFYPSLKVVAHTLLSFEFEDDFLALSVEARTRQDTRYSIAKGLVREFELLYSVGDERDFFVRRTRYLGHDLYLYPLAIPPTEVRAALVAMLEAANALAHTPRFYHSVRDNCTSRLREHARELCPGSFPPFSPADVLPGLSDKILYDKGWIDTRVSRDELHTHYNVKAKANLYADAADFSKRIREGLPPMTARTIRAVGVRTN